MKSDGSSSETKMPVHLAECYQQYEKLPKKKDRRRVKPNKESISRKIEDNAININNHCAELLRPAREQV